MGHGPFTKVSCRRDQVQISLRLQPCRTVNGHSSVAHDHTFLRPNRDLRNSPTPSPTPRKLCMSPPEQSASLSSQPVLDETLSSKPDAEVTPAQDPPIGKPATSDDDDDHGLKSEANAQRDESLIDFGDQPTNVQSQEDNNADAAEEGLSETAKGKQAADDQSAPSGVSNTRISAASKIKPIALPPSNDATTQYLTAEPSTYVDPTPATPTTSQPPSRTPSNAARSHISRDASPSKSDAEYDERRYISEDEQEGGSRSEIQSIMQQFSEFGGGPGEEEVMSPRLEIASPMLGHPAQHPPRKSSLEPLAPTLSNQLKGLHISTSSPPAETLNESAVEDFGPPVPPKDGVHGTPPRPKIERTMSVASPTS
ncbi:hypothetical protein FLONG3_11085, partial [Fusarium longipes]